MLSEIEKSQGNKGHEEIKSPRNNSNKDSSAAVKKLNIGLKNLEQGNDFGPQFFQSDSVLVKKGPEKLNDPSVSQIIDPNEYDAKRVAGTGDSGGNHPISRESNSAASVQIAGREEIKEEVKEPISPKSHSKSCELDCSADDSRPVEMPVSQIEGDNEIRKLSKSSSESLGGLENFQKAMVDEAANFRLDIGDKPDPSNSGGLLIERQRNRKLQAEL